ncbi:hypothetical protein WAI453_012717 [Rhynchosporium graminicola]
MRSTFVMENLETALLAFSVGLDLTGLTSRVDSNQTCPANPQWTGSESSDPRRERVDLSALSNPEPGSSLSDACLQVGKQMPEV